MQIKEAQALRKFWRNAPCDHPHFEKEYYLGADTGDLACTKCGKSLSDYDLDSLRDKQARFLRDIK